MMLLTGLADTLPLVVALRLGVGVAEAAFFVAAFAALADVAPPDRMGEAFSYSSLGLYLGLTLGPPLGEVLVGSFGFTAAWSGAAVLLLLAAVLVHSIGETRPPRTPEDEGPTPFILWTTVPPALGFLTSVVAMGGFLAFASLHAQQVGVARTSLPLAVYGVVVVVCRVVFAKVPDRLPPLRLGAAALVAIAAGMTTAAAWAIAGRLPARGGPHGAGGVVQHPGVLHRDLRGGQAVGARRGLGHGQRLHRHRGRRRVHRAGAHGAEPRHPVGVRGRGGGRARRERLDARRCHAARRLP